MSRRIFLILSFASFAVVSTLSADDSATEILAEVRDRYEEINDAEILFSQEVTFSKTPLEQKASGRLLLKKENMYRLEMNDQTVVTDGATVWSYSKVTQQVIIDVFKTDKRFLTPEKVLTGAPDDFTATVLEREVSGGTDLVVLKLVPRTDDSFITSLKLWVAEDDWLIRRVETLEFSGKKTTYTVRELKTNIGLPADTFSFIPPEGAEVVDLR
jgi:chaperone LolA